MLVEFILSILAIIVGILVGVFTGLLPGIHINLIASIVLLIGLNTGLPLPLAIFIASLSFTHIIIDFIPTTLLGVPGEENFLATQPAHRLVKQGKAQEAISIAFQGTRCSIPFIIITTPLYILFLPYIYPLIEKSILYVLIASSLYLIFREKNILAGLVIFFLSGILGFVTFNLVVNEPLLPLLTGLFGISSIFYSLEKSEKIPKQRISSKYIKKFAKLKSIIPASILTPIFSFFPGLGAGHISLFCSEVVKQSTRQFIFLNSFVSSLNMSLSIVAAYSISKTRTGSAVAIQSLLDPFSLKELSILVLVSIITIIVSICVGKKIAKYVIQIYNLMPQEKISLMTVAFILVVNIILTNSLGLVVLAAATSVGLFAHFLNVRKIQLMGSLLLPTVIYYLN